MADSTERVTLTVTIEIVKDGTEDVPVLLEEINGRSGTLDVAGYRFAAHIDRLEPDA